MRSAHVLSRVHALCAHLGLAAASAVVLLTGGCGDKDVDDTGDPLDADADGYDATVDCDDADPAVHPGAAEVCNGIDDDCDDLIDDDDDSLATTTWYADADGDSFGDPSVTVSGCTQPDGHVADGTDCDDADPAVHPGATEVCSGLDDDCDGLIDDDDDSLDTSTGDPWYRDGDGDGWGASGMEVYACAAPSGWVADDTDCDDTDPAVHPDAAEVCNGLDDDCDRLIDDADPSLDTSSAPTWYADSDGDTYGNPSASVEACDAPADHVADATDCDDTDPDVRPDAAEVCNGTDDDCDGDVDDADPSLDTSTATLWYADADGDAYGDPDSPTLACELPPSHVSNVLDCDDTTADVSPAAAEVCNDVDDDCDGLTDDADPSLDTSTSPRWYRDADGDTWGASGMEVYACAAPSGWVASAYDCDDTDPDVHPAAAEVCNGLDDDCDGDMDDADPSLDTSTATLWYADADADAYGDPDSSTLACELPPSHVSNALDCDDTTADVSPDAAEVCNGVDDDCDGDVDDADPSLDAATTTTWFADTDGDTWGASGMEVYACAAPSGWVASAYDCDDTDPNVRPDAAEVCNGVDDDCDGLTDDADPSLDTSTATLWYADADADAYGDPDSSTLACELPPSHVSNALDCDDTTADVSPTATEVCNGVDDDCDGLTDDADASLDASTTTTWYADADGDGWGDPGTALYACAAPSGWWVADDTDCDDTNPDVRPDAAEVCNGVDDDCDGLTDDADPSVDPISFLDLYEDLDGDGYGDPDVSIRACVAAGYVADDMDCDDTDPWVYPGASELCDGMANDCRDMAWVPADEDGTVAWFPVSGPPVDMSLTWGGASAAAPVTWTAPADGDLNLCDGTWFAHISTTADLNVTGLNGPLSTILDGGGSGIPVTVTGGTTRVSGLTVQGGSNTSDGGGILCRNATLHVDDAVIANNTARMGAGFNAQSCTGTVQSTEINGNTADLWGGGFVMDGSTFTLDGCLIYGNDAVSYGGGAGRLDDGSAVTISNTLVEGNSATYAPGFYIASIVTLDLTDVEIASQTGSSFGSAFYAYSSNVTGTRLVLLDLTTTSTTQSPVLLDEDSSFDCTSCSFTDNDGGLAGVLTMSRPSCSFTFTDTDFDRNTPADVYVNSTPYSFGLRATGSCSDTGCP